MSPADYPRRVLLAVLGTSPQVVTETLYALMTQSPRFAPTEIYLLTTSRGAEKARESLLAAAPTVLQRLAADYGWPALPLTADSIRVISDGDGQPLDDIRNAADNEALADAITDLVRDITDDPDSALHVSIAGGRKSMSFFAGYVLTLFGRQQDRLSHVLVDEALVGTDFFYPRPGDATEVCLADIPFVPMGTGMSDWIRSSGRGFAETIAALRAAEQGEPRLVLDLQQRLVEANHQVFAMSPRNIAFLAMLAQRVLDGRPGYLRKPDDDGDKRATAEEFRRILEPIVKEMGDARTLEAMDGEGLTGEARDRIKSAVNRDLKVKLGEAVAGPYCIARCGKDARRRSLYGLTLKPEHIAFGDLSGKHGAA